MWADDRHGVLETLDHRLGATGLLDQLRSDGRDRLAQRIERRPEFIHECNCSLCSKSGAIWGYFQPAAVVVEGATAGYCRTDKPQPGVSIRFCPNCGATTHFELTDVAIAKFGNTVLGVNMRLADEADLHGVEVRYPDGRSWSDGSYGYVRQPRVLGKPA